MRKLATEITSSTQTNEVYSSLTSNDDGFYKGVPQKSVISICELIKRKH